MLTEEERIKIEAEIRENEQKPAASVGVLKIIQDHRGWVSDESIKDIAQLLEMTPDELDAIATFYSLIFRRKVGRHVILICDSVSCWIMGYEKILDRLKYILDIELGETTPDGRFTLLPVACIGVCDHAPAMIVDKDIHRDLDEESIDDILSKYE
jgi:NADH-quinone oxidoreductase subunit E